MNISFLEWILNKLRINDKKQHEEEWEPEPLTIRREDPKAVVPENKQEDDERKVIIIDI